MKHILDTGSAGPTPDSSETPWFALMVKSRHEKMVSAILRSKGYIEFLPVYRSSHRHAGKTRSVDLPLFAGYTFCQFASHQRSQLLSIPGVLSVVGVGKTPAPVADHEIEALRTVMSGGVGVKPWPYMKAGDRVEIEGGPLCGLRGLLVRDDSKHRVVVSVTLLQRCVAAEVERQWIRPVNVLVHNASWSDRPVSSVP